MIRPERAGALCATVRVQAACRASGITLKTTIQPPMKHGKARMRSLSAETAVHPVRERGFSRNNPCEIRVPSVAQQRCRAGIAISRITIALACCGAAMGAVAGEFRAGVARVNITPPMPFYLSGYAARTNPATSVRTDLWAKALALQDRNGTRLVLVTADLIALPRDVTDVVAGRLMRRHGLRRSQLLFNASHTHSGPVVWSNLRVMFNLDAAEKARALDYAAQLTDKLTSVADAALANLSSAVLACGRGRAGFAVNRRQPTPSGFVIGHNPNGPVDHDVPVLKVAAPDGQLRAVLFGYACHNTTCPMSLEVDGDYAGAAQRALEAAHPGATALFMTLCAGDQNPHPRGSMDWVEKHGRELADAVERVLAG
ncbi:MAG: neutral/alkaline non-lysosomal ceramidase N-terminal domain-containing protein, partial [Verrucomicrobiales bacterium]|nr:neutral/alkaline non-lysosomal ceramidase N-terminal domain-containing protein [Verrucomicrobiales bacterium]